MDEHTPKPFPVKDRVPYYVGMLEAEYVADMSTVSSPMEMSVGTIHHSLANDFVARHHYLHRKLYIARNVSYGLYARQWLVGVCMVGYPVWLTYPGLVPPLRVEECPELLRLATMDGLPKNTESWFVSRCLRHMRQEDWIREVGTLPMVVTSFCDEALGFDGALYKALNFTLVRRTDGRPSNPGGSHGKWGGNTASQHAVKALYVYWYDRHHRNECLCE